MIEILNSTALLQFVALFILNASDFATGMLKAHKKGNVTSRQMGDGFTKKATQFLIAVASFLLMSVSKVNIDLQEYQSIFVLFYNGFIMGLILKELVSIKENLVVLGYLEDISVFDNLINMIKPKNKE